MDENFYKVYRSGKKLVEVIEFLKETNAVGEDELELGMSFKASHERLERSYPHYLERYEREKETMDKYELFAVNHYFSEWPEDKGFDWFLTALENDDDIKDCWPAIEYEGIPNVDMAELVKSMINCLRMTFRKCE